MGKQTPRALHVVVLIAVGFTLAMFLAFLRGRALPLQRPLALCIDLLLVTMAMHSVTGDGAALFQVYYLIVLVGAIWFQLGGAITVALAAITLYVTVPQLLDPRTPWPSLYVIMADLGLLGAPFLLLIAVIAGYLVRTFNREQQAVAQFEQELRLARMVQDGLLPASLPAVPGYQVALQFQPARSVGGDLYNLERLPGGRYLLCLGDMPGKSVYGLVHLSLIHSHTRAAAADGLHPAEIANTVNEDVYNALQPDSYAALFIGLLDADNNTITFANCGHPPPILLTETDWDNPIELSTGGIVIGADHEANYQESQLSIDPGDLLICYTDGVSEARNAKGQEFGLEGVKQTARALAQQQSSVKEIAEAIIRAAMDFSAVPQSDDATVIVFRRET